MPGGALEVVEDGHAFERNAFIPWYQSQCTRVFEPARASFRHLLEALLDRELDDIARARVRLSSRIKSPARLWSKLESDEYRGRADALEDIPDVIDDIVGLRITCNNKSDVVRIREIIATLPSTEDNESASIATDPAEEKLYYLDPKSSGYRAYHINLVTLVPNLGTWTRVVGELQVRTLLQDGWGELTHEDTYKASVGLPPLAEQIARRMADLLAAVDDLAQDLRDELERNASQSVADIVEDREADALDEQGDQGDSERERRAELEPLRAALVDETRRIVGELTRQAPLTQVSQQVRGAFGAEVSDSWGGFGSFGMLLRAAVPDATVIRTPPGYVIPPGIAPVSAIDGVRDLVADELAARLGVPEVVQRLHIYDRSLPEVGPASMAVLTEAIATALSPGQLAELGIELRSPGIRETNVLAKHLRDSLQDGTTRFSRSQIDYVLKALLFSGNLRPGVDRSDTAEILAGWFVSRAQMLGAIDDLTADRDAIRTWIGADRD